MAASEMVMTTRARGTSCRFTVRLNKLAAVDDIERLPINIIRKPCDPEKDGTQIVLTGLHANLAFPDSKKLRQVLPQEYGRPTGFDIVGDGKYKFAEYSFVDTKTNQRLMHGPRPKRCKVICLLRSICI